MASKAATPSSPSFILTSGASGRITALFSVQALKSLLMLINAFFLLLLAPFRGRRRMVVAAARGSSSSSSGDQKFKDDRLLQETSSGVHRTKLRVPATIVPWKSAGGGGRVTAVVDPEVGGRRAIAIKRVLQDDDTNTVREFSLFVTARSDNLFTQSWTPVSAKIRGLVVLMHGLNEHRFVGRYNDFAKELNANGFKVYGMDWIGHGGSDGLHGYVHSLDYAVDDLKSFLDKILTENPGFPCFCFGHSTGAAIVLKAMMDPKVEASVSGVVLTSPAVGIQPSHPLVVILAPVLSFLLPTFQLNSGNKKGMPVSRDPDALVAKYSDPLVYTGSVRVRTGYEILRTTAYLQQNLKRLRVPFLVLHGAADTVTDPDASRKLYEEASSADKTIKLLEGLLHDLLIEPEREEIMKDIIDWFNCRV
ncbi:PREDICTED: monoglyceride lipase-like isoform X1 [Populus euphratica]|uniref:Monoglyceride lipase-like isoform X1 n=1 Tax=Populus euphratica TaxID=75702 RepID=A0AAJ6SXE2_POPEU|nr:PREDICTED: monoglyceride lipase-like isoform X1 [Populus euphratica]